MSAPERIWVDGERAKGGEVYVWNNLPEHLRKFSTEYIRADLAPPPAKVKALVDAARQFADIGVSENPDYQPMVRLDRDAILALRAALAALEEQ